MKAIGYIRVSTEEQGQEERFSLPHQEQHIRKFCKEKGWELTEIFQDTESGKSTRKRTGFKKAMESMQYADILIVHELDRLSRNLLDTLTIINELNSSQKKFVSIHDNIDSSRPEGELQLHILAVFAQYFRSQLSRKVYGSMLTRAETGLWNTKPPLGYSIKEGKLAINPDEEWIVKKIFDMYLENNGFRSIAEELNSLGIRTKRNALWSTFPIKNILCNQAYTGNSIWNKTKRADTKEIKRPEDEWVVVEDTHEPIIDKETFQAVQERMKVKKSMGGRSQSSNYLLSGLLKCGHCGSPMIGNTYKGRFAKKKGLAPTYHKYVCSGYHKQGICHYVFCHREQVEINVLEDIKKIIGTPDQAKSLQRKKKLDKSGIEAEHKKLTSELASTQLRFQRQLEAFEAGVIDLPELKKAKERVKGQEESIKKELSLIEVKLSSLDEAEMLRRGMSNFYEVMSSKDIPQIKAWLQQKIKQITYYDNGSIKIDYII